MIEENIHLKFKLAEYKKKIQKLNELTMLMSSQTQSQMTNYNVNLINNINHVTNYEKKIKNKTKDGYNDQEGIARSFDKKSETNHLNKKLFPKIQLARNTLNSNRNLYMTKRKFVKTSNLKDTMNTILSLNSLNK